MVPSLVLDGSVTYPRSAYGVLMGLESPGVFFWKQLEKATPVHRTACRPCQVLKLLLRGVSLTYSSPSSPQHRGWSVLIPKVRDTWCKGSLRRGLLDYTPPASPNHRLQNSWPAEESGQ